MAGQVEFGWRLSGTGWATCRIADASGEAKYEVSYCTDALADLLNGLGGLYRPKPVERFSFDLEPAEIRWVLRGIGTGLEVSIYRFPDMLVSFDAPDGDGTLSWRSTLSRSRLVHAVVEAAQAVLQEHGEAGYKAKWGRFPFPTASLQDLRRLHLRVDGCDQPHDLLAS
ncbi:hypothetical protein LKL35_05635 [Streptomyces sp. ET3-23]|uniref:hypothetical protein n=1 Tax=Streptomyces sp. ET3-23 TaxID=2885643 RepID=UPI001D104CF9|nr:hypothetical protein [Streptomyces sp. ET3-23]MCC2274918.1 hypothetical protein [Streptomyces sp. ET3-23]